MDFTITDEQSLLRDGLTRFLATRYDVHKSRAAVASGPGWQPEIWRAFADELGILGAAAPDEVGGSGGGPVETMLIAEALGHALVVEPFIDTAVVAAGLLRRAGGVMAADLLRRLVAGDVLATLAATEPQSGHDWRCVATIAECDGDDWVLTGEKTVVPAGPLAEVLLVTARTAGAADDAEGISLFCVPAQTPGLSRHDLRTIDARVASDVTFTGARVGPEALLGDAGTARESLALARDEGAAAVCAEAVGAMRKVLADTVEYCRGRHQFGRALSDFQVLQHRMVDMYMEVEQASAATLLATLRLDSPAPVRGRAVSAAKATVGRAARYVGQQAVQLHGGMGMTDELAVGHYFTRLTALQYEFGTTDQHIARYAALTAG